MTSNEKPEESWKRRGVSATESGGQKRQLKIFPEFFPMGWEISLVEKRLVIIVKKEIFPLLHLFSSVTEF